MMPRTNSAVTATIGPERRPMRYRLRINAARSTWPRAVRPKIRDSSRPWAPTKPTMSDRLPKSAASDGEASAGSVLALTQHSLPPGAATAKRAVRYRMPSLMAFDSRRIALQLWTLRDHLQTADDVARSFARVREIGYEHVQLSGLGPIPSAEVKKLADAAGLGICATHEDARQIV